MTDLRSAAQSDEALCDALHSATDPGINVRLGAAARIRELVQDLHEIYFYVEPHYRGAGVQANPQWAIDRLNSRYSSCADENDELDKELTALRSKLDAVPRYKFASLQARCAELEAELEAQPYQAVKAERDRLQARCAELEAIIGPEYLEAYYHQPRAEQE